MSNNLMKKLVKWNTRKQQHWRLTLSAEADWSLGSLKALPTDRAKCCGEAHGNAFGLLEHASQHTALLRALANRALHIYLYSSL